MFKKRLSGHLVMESALHVGTGKGGGLVDSPVYRDSRNEVVIPGTSIAGALRTLATRIAPNLGLTPCVEIRSPGVGTACDCAACQLFGSVNPQRDLERGFPSKIWVYDAPLAHDSPTFVRDGVGIDRETNAASRAGRVKFNYEVLPKGAQFELLLELDPDVTEEQEVLLASALAEWTHGRCFLGGNKARGCGRAILQDLSLKTIDLGDPSKIISWLRGHPRPLETPGFLQDRLSAARQKISSAPAGTPVPRDNAPPDIHALHSYCELTLTASFPSGIVVNDPQCTARTGVDFFPKHEHGEFVVPGSSFRGVLRSQAERIARTLTTNATRDVEDFLHRCPACDPNSGDREALRSCHHLLKQYRRDQAIPATREVTPEELCLACQLFGSPYRGSRLFASDGVFNGGVPLLKKRDFLAIDRFTGGGKEGAKYDGMVLMNPTFTFRLYLENPAAWELGWLLLAIQDLEALHVGVGAGQNKGFGHLRLDSVQAAHGYFPGQSALFPAGTDLPGSPGTVGVFTTRDFSCLHDSSPELSPHLERWVTAFTERVACFEREPAVLLPADTYHGVTVNGGTSLETLYPKTPESLQVFTLAAASDAGHGNNSTEEENK